LADFRLFSGDALGGGAVGRAGCIGGRVVIGDGARKRRLLVLIRLLILAALFAPVMRLAFLDDEQDAEGERHRDAGDALHVEQAEKHHGCPSESASIEAPSLVAVILKRPTGPPARRPTITATMAAMNPHSDQPKITTMLCSA